MLGRSAIQDLANPIRDGRSRLGAETVYELEKSYPSKLYAQTPPPTGPPWRGIRAILTGGLAAAPRYAMVNIEQTLPVIVVRLSPPLAAGRHNQARYMNRIRSSYALLPGAGQ